MPEDSPNRPTSPSLLTSDEVADLGRSTATPDGDTPRKGVKAAEGRGDVKTFSQLLAGAMAGSQKGTAPGAESSSDAVVSVPVVPVASVVPSPGFLIEASGFGVSTD